MADIDRPDLMTDAELVAAFTDNVMTRGEIEHVGATNRHYHRLNRLTDEMARRGGGPPEGLRPLLRHDDIDVRRAAALAFKDSEPATYVREMRALKAEGVDIGIVAERDIAGDSDVGIADRRQDRLAPEELAGRLHWQANTPPPAPPGIEEISRALTEAAPRAASTLLALARPAIGLWPRSPPGDLPPSASRLGGLPHAPNRWEWPTVGEEPMLFLGQIDCRDLRSLPGADLLPRDGVLAFFGDFDAVHGSAFDGGDCAVYHWPDRAALRPVAPLLEILAPLPLCAVALRPLIDMPDPASEVVRDALDDDVEAYRAFHTWLRTYGVPDDVRYMCGFGKLLGWPHLVQHDDIEADGDEGLLRLLLQLDQYTNGVACAEFGSGGSLYFVMSEDSLAKRRFKKCEMRGQFT
jgi:hypothetical protein